MKMYVITMGLALKRSLKGCHLSNTLSDLTRKSGFSKIEQNADVGKPTKISPRESTRFSHCPSPKMNRIGSLSMKLSSNNDQTVISSYLRQK